MNRRILLISLALLGGCATPRPVAPAPLAELEPIYGVSAGHAALTISVASNGCTTKADFTFYVEKRGGEATIAFARRKPDPCQSFAMGRTDLSFTYAELGLGGQAPVFVLNPVVAWTGPGAA